MKVKKYIYASFLSIFVLLATVGSVYAADFRVGDKDNGNVSIRQGEVVKNLYTAGGAVSIDAEVQKSLYVAGGMVTVNGRVEDSLFSGAGNLLINGEIGKSLHAGGGSVIVNGKVGDDLIIGGGNVVVAQTSSIGGDLVIGGGVVDLEAPVLGDVYLGGGNIFINSEIGGNVKITQADKIKLGSNAKINGNLEYSSKNEIEKDASAVVLGETKKIEGLGASGKGPDKGTVMTIIFAIISVAVLIKLGGPIALGLLAVHFFKNQSENVVRESLNNFWRSLGIGLMYLLVTPIVAVLLMITLVGIPLGMIVLMLYVISLILAATFAGIAFGAWAWGVIKKNKDYNLDWKIVVGGVLVFAIIKSFPVLGGIFGFVFLLISMGAICSLVYGAVRPQGAGE